jgi:hypothetical protein
MGLQKVKYKKPRKINPISITLTLVFGTLGFLAYQYVPLSLKRGEAVRVLDEAASKYAGQPGRYRKVPKEVERLRKQMRNDLQLVGVMDPDMEVWIEADSDFQVRFGALYSEWIDWPFDVIERQEKVYEIEYKLELKK